MTKYIRGISTPLALTLALMLSACTVSEKKSDSALATDSALNKDLQLAGRDTAVQPALQDVPTTPAAEAPAATTTRPTTTKPKPAPPKPKPATPAPAPTTTTTASGNTETKNPTGSASSAAGGAVGTIASGTSLTLRSNERVCTNTHHVGSTFSATLANSVTGSNGATIPAGATVSLEVTQLKRSENATDKIVMEFAVNSVSFGGKTYPLDATVQSASVDRVKDQPGAKDAQKVAIGAAVGAIAGRIIGKSTKGTIIGGAAGAAAGAATAAATSNYQGCIPSGGSIVIRLTSAATVRA